MQFQNNGYCFFLNEKNGIFSCDVYESRPHICKNFPSESTQQDVCDANSKRLLNEAGCQGKRPLLGMSLPPS
jgi:Fe-S-cluster containining protein